MVRRKNPYAVADTAQQLVGGFLLAGPFVVTQEVWLLASRMAWYHVLGTLALVFAIGYGALYKADRDHNPEHEVDVVGIPVRFVSLMIISFGSVLVLALAFNAPSTFAKTLNTPIGTWPVVILTVKATAVGAVFSVVGAATADSIF